MSSSNGGVKVYATDGLLYEDPLHHTSHEPPLTFCRSYLAFLSLSKGFCIADGVILEKISYKSPNFWHFLGRQHCGFITPPLDWGAPVDSKTPVAVEAAFILRLKWLCTMMIVETMGRAAWVD